MEDLLRKATKTLWLMRRDITAEQKRETAAVKEWREKHQTEPVDDDDEEAEEGEPGMITRDGGGKALTKACRGCGRIHGGGNRIRKRCHAKLPGGARQAQCPAGTRRASRGPLLGVQGSNRK